MKGESGEFRPTGVDVYGHYDSNLNCTWFIRTGYYHEIHLLITILDIDVAEPCEDYLQVIHSPHHANMSV